ncbi:molybdate transport system substrate-binding protein [Sporobacter termitidis DSM 10068]|uniref:Molybdate transport system substrate-binding protein n=1 Tax=Sporobacter termitidis DSM 10068 TaxID=1123282 RepID=A0A1M5XDA9_9FIRM|nr:molybdate ABC transporter substrate-binding protein [Sporobacter termitidis]SHH97837.1 molybdate transport system substrate-binding protein [Sporobacter termitidis DSM 10068]
MKHAFKITALFLAILLTLAPIADIGAAAGTGLPALSASRKVDVFAAASLTDPLNDIAKLYAQANPTVKIAYRFGASGDLSARIEKGARADLFISAATQQMDTLEQKGLIADGTRTNLLGNDIVLIVPANSARGITRFEECATDKVRSVAIGDPASVPAGQYAKEVFTSLGIWDKVEPKAKFGSDVRQVLSMVASGAVDCGVVYKTDALTEGKVKIAAVAPENSHSPVVYPAAVVKAGRNQNGARDFMSFLKSEAAMQVFTKYGFKTLK